MIGDNDKLVKRVHIGDVSDLWRSICNRQTPHVFGYFAKHYLTCLVCHPEAEEYLAKEKQDREHLKGELK